MLELSLVTWGLASEVSPTQARGPSFSVTYAGAADCPSRATFEAAILARAPAARVVHDEAQAEVRFEAELVAAPAEKRRLRVALRDGTSQDREIDADDCAEAVQSMAVIAAMVLASRAAEPEPSATEAPPEPAETKPPEPSRSQAEPPKPAPAAATTRPPERRARRTWLASGAGVGLEGAAAPAPAFAALAFGELGSMTRGWLAPSLRLTAVAGQAPEVRTDAGRARFRLLLGRVHGCALRWSGLKLDLRLCAVIEGGALFGRGIDALNERSAAMGWLGVGAGAIGELRAAARWGVELGGGARALLTRDEFVFAPGTKVHQPPVVAWNFHLGLNYRLW